MARRHWPLTRSSTAGVQRKLFADFSAGELPASLKKVYLQRYGIPARMFNGVRVSLEGKVSSVRETMVLRRDGLERRIARAEREIDKAVKGGRWAQVHRKRRRLANLRFRLAGLEADVAAGRVRLCFGSKRLWRKQYDLEVSGYGSHEEWLVRLEGVPERRVLRHWGAGMKRRVANYASPR